jgi:predicted component of type VI protein secretion system
MLMRLQHKRPDGEVDTYHLKPGRKYHLGRGSSCELRILDLKLSRKHCCIEFVKGAWQIEDLGSTNGCKVNGQQIVGTKGLAKDQRIEAGTTTMVVTGFVDAEQADGAVQQEVLPDGGDSPMSESGITGGDWEPEPASENLVKTGALQPVGARKAGPAPALKAAVQAQSEGDGSITLAPNTMFASTSALTPRDSEDERGSEPAAPPATASPPTAAVAAPSPRMTELPVTAETRPSPKIKPVTIRVGRVDGGELHTPTATPALPDDSIPTAATFGSASEPAPAPAPAPGRSATDSNGERAFFITVLGRRVGPLSRAMARDLKAKELKGLLTLAELDSYPKA